MRVFAAIIGFAVLLAAGAASATSISSIDYAAAPLSIAVDNEGRFYATDQSSGSVSVFANSGKHLFDITGVGKPLGIAASPDSVYVGDGMDGSVKVFDLTGSLVRTLGAGEFKSPSGIAVSVSGDVYVTDSPNNIVRAYRADGSFAFSFTSTGLSFPTGISVDDATDELYISDSGNGRINIYDAQGIYKRSIAYTGMTRPQGVEVDSSGNVYVTDTYQSIVLVFDNWGMFVRSLGGYGSGAGYLKTPAGVAVDRLNKVFVTSVNTGKIEVFGLNGYNGLTVSPSSLSFKVEEGKTSPQQKINIGSLANPLDWTASTDSAWLLLGPASGQTPSELNISADASALKAGVYSSIVKVSAAGVSETVNVLLEVTPPASVLEVMPASINIRAQADGLPKTASIIVSGTEGLAWSLSATSAPWLKASSVSGVVPATVIITLNPEGMSAGAYSASIAISADGGAKGSPALVPVSFELIDAGNIDVRTNHPMATFDIKGPESLSGSGTSASFVDAPSGEYTITFGPIKGFKTPPEQKATLGSGKTVTFTAVYGDLRKQLEIVATGNSSFQSVKVFRADGTPVMEFKPFDEPAPILETAVGDVDGDGSEDIIVAAGPNRGRVKAFTNAGIPIAGLDFTAYDQPLGADVAAKDLNGDGKAEIITGAYTATSRVRVFSYTGGAGGAAGGAVKAAGIDFFAYEKVPGINISAGDMDGDGLPEIITSPKRIAGSCPVNIYKANASGAVEQWSVSHMRTIDVSTEPSLRCNVASGDINADGTDEVIALLYPLSSERNAIVKVFSAEGVLMKEFDAGTDAVLSIAAGDIDMDGASEVFLGGRVKGLQGGTIELFSPDGIRIGSLRVFERPVTVNVSTGDIIK